MVYLFIFVFYKSIMLTKSEKTTKYIIETVAPIFNKKGYEATSMKDITSATSLTKGAIYGNFKNTSTNSLHLYTQLFSPGAVMGIKIY